MPTPTPRPLPELLTALRLAVRARDYDRATELEQDILRRLAEEAAKGNVPAEYHDMEQQVRALMAELDSARPDDLEQLLTISTKSATRADAALPPIKPEQDVLFRVWFGTNRQATADGQGFTNARAQATSRGRVEVRIPPAHQPGGTGTGIWNKLWRWDFRDDQLRFGQLTPLAEEDFFAGLRQAVTQAQAKDGEKHALVFLHGYNNTFEDAAIRAAQLGFDLGVNGPTAFFSWPSGGSVMAYPADEAAIEASEQAITDFLVDFAAHCPADRIHLIAHSMGNRGLLRALQRIAGNAETLGRVRFDQIILAAPDVDQDVFQGLARLYPECSRRTTIYASRRDLPVHLSFWLHRAPRVGYFEPYTIAPGIDTVAVPGFNIDLLGHAYFAQAKPMLDDIAALLYSNQAPAARKLDQASSENGAYWRMPE